MQAILVLQDIQEHPTLKEVYINIPAGTVYEYNEDPYMEVRFNGTHVINGIAFVNAEHLVSLGLAIKTKGTL